MKIVTLILSTILLMSISWHATAQCNGDPGICSKRFDEVAYLTTHNAFNTDSEGFNYPNQNYGIAQQLNDGVRGFMLDVYDLFGTPTQYHGTWLLGSQALSSDLNEIRQFLDNNPNEIVTIILECYVSANDIESELNSAGLSTYLYTKPSGGDWATLQEMIDDNTRLVILTDAQDASSSQEWYHYAWDHAVETHYSVNLIGAFTNDYNRGDAVNDLFIFNHFITDVTLGVGVEPDALIVNAYDFLMPRIEQHYAEKSKFPNFITLDFYDLGEGKRVVDSLNADHLTLGLSEQDKNNIQYYPNPAKQDLHIDGLSNLGNCSIQLLTLEGKTIYTTTISNVKNAHLDVSNLSAGVYLIQILKSGSLVNRKKLIIQ